MGLFFMSTFAEDIFVEEEKLRIGQGSAEAFLVCDKSLGDYKAPFYAWLAAEGYTFAGYHGNYGCSWAYINISRKQYAYGMPGVHAVKPIGNHAITMDEFMTIYRIYEQYRGKPPLVFHSQNCDYDAIPGTAE